MFTSVSWARSGTNVLPVVGISRLPLSATLRTLCCLPVLGLVFVFCKCSPASSLCIHICFSTRSNLLLLLLVFDFIFVLTSSFVLYSLTILLLLLHTTPLSAAFCSARYTCCLPVPVFPCFFHFRHQNNLSSLLIHNSFPHHSLFSPFQALRRRTDGRGECSS